MFTANDPTSPKVHYREGYLATVQIKPGALILFRCTSAEFLFSCCGGVAALGAKAWAKRPITCGASRAVPQATAWTQRSSTYDKQRAVPRATAWAPRPSTCELFAAPRAKAWAPLSSTYAAPRSAAWATRPSTCDAHYSALSKLL